MNPSIKRNRNLNEPGEIDRLFARVGIFPNAIKEYGELLKSAIHRPRKNQAK